jgi:hypothetical protein
MTVHLPSKPSKHEAPTSNPRTTWCWWLTPVILASQEAEIRRIVICSQPLALFMSPYLKNTHH